MKVTHLTSLMLMLHTVFYAQNPYNDFIGAGHSEGIIVTSSSDLSKPYWNKAAIGANTLNGEGLDGKKAEAARLLTQASFGFYERDLNAAAGIGPLKWINDQLQKPSPDYFQKSIEINNFLSNYYLSKGVDSSDISFFPGWTHWRYGLWHQIMFGDDQLRQRMTFALSQILVISDEVVTSADALGGYYTILSKHAFGNFKDLLLEVTLSPAMGYYLSHLNNPKEIPEENIRPDQNYAREIMQLFSIGLVQLNMDGTPKLDDKGNTIPTYTNEDIAEMAKIFTGLGIGAVYPEMGDLYFGRGIYGADMTKAMIMYENWHQEGEKHLLNGLVVPAGQSGMKDIEDAINMLFMHENTPPFISKQLIQRFVTSNPSPAYIDRIANVFANDGQGVRGNLGAVIHAILMDEEARSCEQISNPEFGKMYEPIIRYAHLVKGIDFSVKPGDIYLNHAYDFNMRFDQHPLSAPSVFNFFKPDHQPLGEIADANLVAPEFQILNSLTVMEGGNVAFDNVYYNYSYNNWEGEYGDFEVYNNLIGFVQSSLDDEVLINHIDLLLLNGNMSDHTRNVIKHVLSQMGLGLEENVEKIKMTLYLASVSPDFIINK
jgi:uncharacterized protein (DUF1800 family)